MFNKLVWTVMLLLSGCALAFGQARGVVRDLGTQQPLAGATVSLLKDGKTTVTNAEGVFQFEGLDTRDYDAEIRFVGYKTLRVILEGGIENTFSMEEAVTFTDEVMVMATRAGDKTPTTFSTIDKPTLRKQNFGQDLPIILNWSPSVVSTSDAGNGIGYTGITIRGSDATRINVTLNGIPYNDSESQGVFWVDIPDIASSTQSVQIQRGVGTSTNGPGAFGASINLQTNTLNQDPYAEYINSFGSFNTWRNTLGFGTGLIRDRWAVDGRVSKISSDGFIDRASSDLSSYYFSAGYYSQKTVLKAIVFGGKEVTYQSWYGVPESRLNNDTEAMLVTASNEGWNAEQTQHLLNSNSRTFNIYTYDNQVDDYAQDHYQLHASHRFTDFLTGNVSLHYTYGRGFYEEYRYNDRFSNYGLNPVVIGDSIITRSDIIRRRWLDNDFYGLTFSLAYEKDKWSSLFGGAWNRYDGRHFGEIIWSQVTAVPKDYRYYFSDAEKQDFTVYLKNNYQVTSMLNAFLDLQYRGIGYTTAGNDNRQNNFDVDVQYNFFNPKAGLVVDLKNRQQLYASYAIANREPVRKDFIDNPENLSPKHETLGNLEIGFRKNSERQAFNINVYWMNYKNQLVLTGALNDVGAPIRTNVDKSYRVGVEVDGMLRLTEKLTWNANLTLSRNKIREFNEVLYDYGLNFDEFNVVVNTYKNSDIAFSPNLIAGSVLRYAPVSAVEVALLTKYVGAQFMDNTSNTNRQLDAYLTNDLRLTYTIKPRHIKEVGLSVLFNNVLNVAYESNGYTYGYLGGGDVYRENFYYPQAGRNFMVMLSIRL
ncbi:MAG TPA: TonB-dependent receptor [Cyclobacteriaceae bacterium]|nr:TonB-dependent receptor [Cyclobacteriaceae bacterium]HRJ81969.1 TonB-dependent receptor [Cyclobacteriaceae bacterium]